MLKCPECGNEGPFTVHADVFISLHNDGFTYDRLGDVIDWDEGSDCACEHCGYQGTVEDFEDGE